MNNEKTLGVKSKRALVLLAVCIGIVLLILLLKFTDAFSGIAVVIGSIKALLFGIVFAALLAPMQNWFENAFKKILSKPDKPRKEMVRMLSITAAMAVLLFIIISLLIIVIPQVGITLAKIIPSFGEMINGLNSWVKGFSDSQVWVERVYPMFEDFTGNIANWILDHFGFGTEAYQSLTSGIFSAFNGLLNIFVGLVLSVYLLWSKEKLFGQIRKLCISIFKEKWGNFIMEAVDEARKIFSGFFAAKILEAIVMGVICFFVMFIAGWPYATLVSVLVGFCNIIPFFGPYIGTIIGAAIVLLVNPWQALGFVIFMIILIQFDGNILGPKILGHSTGLSAMWIIIAILLFTGCFGIVGAFIGVPIFAWIYYIVKRLVEHSLKNQGLPKETQYYSEEEEKVYSGDEQKIIKIARKKSAKK